MAGDEMKVPGPGDRPDPATGDAGASPGRRGRRGREPREPVTIDLTAQAVTDPASGAPDPVDADTSTISGKPSRPDGPDAPIAEPSRPDVPVTPDIAAPGTSIAEPMTDLSGTAGAGSSSEKPAGTQNADTPPADPVRPISGGGGSVPPSGRTFGAGRTDEPADDARATRPSTGALAATGLAGAVGGALLALLTITIWPGVIPGHDAMQARLTSAEQAARGAATQDAVRGLQQSTTQAREADGRVLRETQAVTTQLQQGLADLRQNLRDPALIERIDRLETALASRDGQPSPAALDMLRRLDTRMGALETRAGAQASASAAARLVVLGRIRDALSAGTPFIAEAKALGTLGIGEQSTATLGRIAGGPPSGGALRSQFLGLRPALLAREGESDLWSWAKGALSRAVSVRRVDDASTTPDALASRIENAIAAGRMREARGLWDSLPQAARDRTGQQGAAFLQALDARAQAETTVETLTGEALSALGQTQSGQTQSR